MGISNAPKAYQASYSKNTFYILGLCNFKLSFNIMCPTSPPPPNKITLPDQNKNF